MPRTASPDRGGASDKQQGGPHALHLTLRNTHRPDAKSMQVLRRHAKPTIGATGRSRAHHQQEGQRAPQKKKTNKKKNLVTGGEARQARARALPAGRPAGPRTASTAARAPPRPRRSSRGIRPAAPQTPPAARPSAARTAPRSRRRTCAAPGHCQGYVTGGAGRAQGASAQPCAGLQRRPPAGGWHMERAAAGPGRAS